jgi:hypothetical protein
VIDQRERIINETDSIDEDDTKGTDEEALKKLVPSSIALAKISDYSKLAQFITSSTDLFRGVVSRQ